jgi:hypothetical protein
MKNLNKFLLSCVLIVTVILFIQKRSFAIVYTINVTLSGAQEVPPAASPGTGTLTGTYDDVTNIIDFSIVFSGLVSPTNNAHFHAPAPRGVNAPVIIGFVPGFPLNVTSGNYDSTFTLTAGQETQLLDGLVYVNIHTNMFPGGEIRAQLDQGTLPVELSSFISNVNKNNVTLNWSTTKEINNAGFEVERKLSSSTEWTRAGNVVGNSNSHELKNYTFSERINTGVYNYRLKQIDFNGNFEYFNLSNEVIVELPTSSEMSQNYPNPFNPSTKIDYELPADGEISLILYDISGREVANIVNEFKTAGYYTANFNASNLSSGIYFYKLSAEKFTQTKKMMLIK